MAVAVYLLAYHQRAVDDWLPGLEQLVVKNLCGVHDKVSHELLHANNILVIVCAAVELRVNLYPIASVVCKAICNYVARPLSHC